MPKSLAAGRMKFIACLTKPANPAAPTVAELAAGLDLSCEILDSDFTWTATDSDKLGEKPLCVEENVNAIGASNYTAGFTLFLNFDATSKNLDPAEAAGFAALKQKGTTFWGYARQTAKKSTDAIAASDEIYLGGEVITDEPQQPSDMGGYIKRRIPLEMQRAYPNITVSAT